MAPLRAWLLVLAAGLAAGCATTRPAVPDSVVATPDRYANQPANATAPLGDAGGAGAWWRTLGDPGLDALVSDVLRDNPSLQAADARLRQSDAALATSSAGLWPSVNLEASVSRGRQIIQTPLGNDSATGNRFSLALAASYEIDAWGRVRGQRVAATLDRDAVADDANVTAITLTAEAVEAWLDAVQAAHRRALTEGQVETNLLYLDLALERFSVGLNSALDLYQQRQQVEALQAQFPTIDVGAAVARLRLAALRGRPAGDGLPVSTPNELPPLPPLPATGVPADLVLARPDVRAAVRRAQAADARVSVAVADRLPQLRLSGSVGLQSDAIETLFDDFVWNFALGLVQPLFDGGRRALEVVRTEAVRDERLAQLRQALLGALREVEDALVREAAQQAVVAEIARQQVTAQRSLEAARDQYGQGVIDYLRVLTALQTLQRLEQDLVTAHRQAWSARISLYRALGGDPRAALAVADLDSSSDPEQTAAATSADAQVSP